MYFIALKCIVWYFHVLYSKTFNCMALYREHRVVVSIQERPVSVKNDA